MGAEDSLSGGQFDEKLYKHHYNRGWKSGASYGGLERADERGEPDPWYDGYMDRAVGRTKFAHFHAKKAGKSIEEYDEAAE